MGRCATASCTEHYFTFIVSHPSVFYMLSPWCKVLSDVHAVVDVCVRLCFTLMCQSASCFQVTGTKGRVITPELFISILFLSLAVVTILDIVSSFLVELRCWCKFKGALSLRIVNLWCSALFRSLFVMKGCYFSPTFHNVSYWSTIMIHVSPGGFSSHDGLCVWHKFRNGKKIWSELVTPHSLVL